MQPVREADVLMVRQWHEQHRRDRDYNEQVTGNCRLNTHGKCRSCECPCHTIEPRPGENPDGSLAFGCWYCPEAFRTPQERKSHMQVDHPDRGSETPTRAPQPSVPAPAPPAPAAAARPADVPRPLVRTVPEIRCPDCGETTTDLDRHVCDDGEPSPPYEPPVSAKAKPAPVVERAAARAEDAASEPAGPEVFARARAATVPVTIHRPAPHGNRLLAPEPCGHPGCSFTSSWKPALLGHRRQHSDTSSSARDTGAHTVDSSGDHSCGMAGCDRSFFSATSLAKHEGHHRRWRCLDCGPGSWSTRAGLDEHRFIQHGEGDAMQIVTARAAEEEHLAVEHVEGDLVPANDAVLTPVNDAILTPVNDGPSAPEGVAAAETALADLIDVAWACPWCRQRRFGRPELLQEHIESNHSPTPPARQREWVCVTCGFRGEDEATSLEHFATHESWDCPFSECDFDSPTPDGLVAHISESHWPAVEHDQTLDGARQRYFDHLLAVAKVSAAGDSEALERIERLIAAVEAGETYPSWGAHLFYVSSEDDPVDLQALRPTNVRRSAGGIVVDYGPNTQVRIDVGAADLMLMPPEARRALEAIMDVVSQTIPESVRRTGRSV